MTYLWICDNVQCSDWRVRSEHPATGAQCPTCGQRLEMVDGLENQTRLMTAQIAVFERLADALERLAGAPDEPPEPAWLKRQWDNEEKALEEHRAGNADSYNYTLDDFNFEVANGR